MCQSRLRTRVHQTRFDVGVGGHDQRGESCRVGGGVGRHTHMAHASTSSLQQARGVVQIRTQEESHVDVGPEDVDVAESRALCVSVYSEGTRLIGQEAVFEAKTQQGTIRHRFQAVNRPEGGRDMTMFFPDEYPSQFEDAIIVQRSSRDVASDPAE